MTRDRVSWEAGKLMRMWERKLRDIPALPLLVVAAEHPVEARNVVVLIDHGHTAEALASVLETARRAVPQRGDPDPVGPRTPAAEAANLMSRRDRDFWKREGEKIRDLVNRPKPTEADFVEVALHALIWLKVQTWPERALCLRTCGCCGHGLADVVPMRSPWGCVWLEFQCRRCGAMAGQVERWVVPWTEGFPPFYAYHVYHADN